MNDTEYKMQIRLSRDKCEENGYSFYALNHKIRDLFIRQGAACDAYGVFKSDDYKPFLYALWNLPDTDWFLKVVDRWWFWESKDDLDGHDSLATYYRYN